MKLRKIPRYLALRVLVIGASLIIGFLSFSGMLALWPILPLAFAAFGLSVAYEWEVYLQNIKGAWDKLFKRDHLKHQLAKDYLLNAFPDTDLDDLCPQFFKDYETQLDLLHQFGHKKLDEPSEERKKQIEKTLSDMEKWFAKQLFADEDAPSRTSSSYEDELHAWLLDKQQDEYTTKFVTQNNTLQGVKLFSLLAGIFMGLGTTYLLVEAFSFIPFFIALPLPLWPALIVPMATIAGTAYGLLTYNAVTDMISNDTLRKWFNKIQNRFNTEGFTWQNVFITTATVFLVTLAIALTICTAGTWWTVAKETRPLFTWMGKMPAFIMGVINPIITGLSALIFNLQNTSESLALIDDAARKENSVFARTAKSIKDGFNAWIENEHWLQWINPFRLILKITLLPLRILLFLGHLISIGVTADRVPGISQLVSALLGIISEGFEDFHYFVGHNDQHEHHHHDHDHTLHHKKKLREERLSQEQGHHHDDDIPTWMLNGIFSPIYFLAAGWDYYASKFNHNPEKSLSFQHAWDKQTGNLKEKVTLRDGSSQPSDDWQMEHVIFRIEHYKEEHLKQVSIGSDITEQKINALTRLQQDLRSLDSTDKVAMKNRLEAAKNNPIYNTHRFFDNGKTETAMFIDELPERIGLRVG